jgi:hypothetical protein
MLRPLAVLRARHGQGIENQGAPHTASKNNAALRVIPDLGIIILGVLPLAYSLITTYPHLKAREIRGNGSVWERRGIDL